MTATMTLGNASGASLDAPILTKIVRPAEKVLVKQAGEKMLVKSGEKILVKQSSGRGMRGDRGNDGRPLPMPGGPGPQRKASQAVAPSAASAPVSPPPTSAPGAAPPGGATPGAPAGAMPGGGPPGGERAVAPVELQGPPMSKEDQKRMQIVSEILSTEKSYVVNLNVITTVCAPFCPCPF